MDDLKKQKEAIYIKIFNTGGSFISKFGKYINNIIIEDVVEEKDIKT